MRQIGIKYLVSGFVAALGLAGAAWVIPASAQGSLGVSQPEVSLDARGSFAAFTPATVDPRLARYIAERGMGRGRLMRFTPAAAPNRTDRSITVAVRIDEETARAITIRQTAAAVGADSSPSIAARSRTPVLPITSSSYSLGVSRGFSGFAEPVTLPSSARRMPIPDLRAQRPTSPERSSDSRFGARVALEEERAPGRAPRTREGLGDQSVEVEGSYSVTRNLDVTAGVRVTQDRDRLTPLTDSQQDDQAVYVGTEFRF